MLITSFTNGWPRIRPAVQKLITGIPMNRLLALMGVPEEKLEE